MIKNISCIQDVLDISPTALTELINKDYLIEIPVSCETIEDLNEINKLLPIVVNKYSFLISIASFLKVRIRAEKRANHKEISEDLIDKSAVINNAIESLKMAQKTLSRMVTIKNLINEEMKMV